MLIEVTAIHVLLFFRSFLLEDRCRFLSNFSLATADVEISGEYLVPKVIYYMLYPLHVHVSLSLLITRFTLYCLAHALLCAHRSLHASSGNCAEAELNVLCEGSTFRDTMEK